MSDQDFQTFYAESTAYLATKEYDEFQHQMNRAKYEFFRKLRVKQLQQDLQDCIDKDGNLAFFIQKELGISHLQSVHANVIQDYVARQKDENEKKSFAFSKLTSQQTHALFVTLAPKPINDIDRILLEDLLKIFSKGKGGIEKVYFSIENYGSVSEHPHSHMLIKLDKTTQNGERSRISKWLTSKFHNYIDSPHSLQIKPVSAKKLQEKIDYVTGDKIDPAKKELVEKDKIWRKERGYENFYLFDYQNNF